MMEAKTFDKKKSKTEHSNLQSKRNQIMLVTLKVKSIRFFFQFLDRIMRYYN